MFFPVNYYLIHTMLNEDIFIYICKVVFYMSVLFCFYVVSDSKNFFHSQFIVLWCYKFIVFSHILSFSCFVLYILDLVIVKIRLMYQLIWISSNLHFGIHFKNIYMKWILFGALNICCRNAFQHGWFHIDFTPVWFFSQNLSDIKF